MASLKQAGFDDKSSNQIISTGLRHNFFTPPQKDFVRAVAAARRKGVPHSQITAAALSTMENKGSVVGFCSRLGVS